MTRPKLPGNASMEATCPLRMPSAPVPILPQQPFGTFAAVVLRITHAEDAQAFTGRPAPHMHMGNKQTGIQHLSAYRLNTMEAGLRLLLGLPEEQGSRIPGRTDIAWPSNSY